MARPQKNNADYFPHDATMRDDRKVKALRTRYGLEGYAVWCILLEILTDADNFTLPWDALNQELVAGDIGIETSKLIEIVGYMKDVQLIQHNPDTQQLYTTRHHERMKPILDERERKRQWKQEQIAKATAKTPAQKISDGENAQSKVKEIKVNESKENPSYEGESHAPAHEEDFENQKNETPTPHPEPFTAAHTAIREWARPDDFKALRDIAAETRYDPAIHGPVADEVLKFTAYYLDPRRHPNDRTAFQADPVHFFQQRIRKWLLDAKNLNRQPKTAAKKTQYQPPPPHQRQRTNSNANETTHIGNIAGKIITEFA